MPTFANMVDEVSGHLRAYTTDQDPKTSLGVGITTADTQFTVLNSDRLAAGLIEIDEELVEVASVDSLSNAVTLHPWGRAQQGTAAATHAIGARVTVSPRWPRSRVKRTINEVIAGLWPDLFVVRSDSTNVGDPTIFVYPLPAEARRIVDMTWADPWGPQYGNIRFGGWKLDPSADTALYPSGVTVEIAEGVWPGTPIQVLYAAEPSPMVSDSDDFATTTGLHEGVADLVCIGAAARLVTAMELSGAQLFTVEHSQRLDGRSPGGATAASRYLMQLYQTRLQAERARLFAQYPPRIRRTW